MNDTPHVNMQLAVARMSIHVALKEFAAARDVLLAALDSQANLPDQLTTSSVYRYLRDIAREMAVERNEREKERALLYGALPQGDRR